MKSSVTVEMWRPANVSTGKIVHWRYGSKCFTTPCLGAPCSSSSSETAHSKTSECYVQAWAWLHRAGSARRASGLAAGGGGEPRAPHLGSSPVSNPCTLGTIHQPKQDSPRHDNMIKVALKKRRRLIYHCCCSSGTLTLTSLPSYQGYQFVTVGRESASMEYLVPVRGTTESASPLPDNMSNVRD